MGKILYLAVRKGSFIWTDGTTVWGCGSNNNEMLFSPSTSNNSQMLAESSDSDYSGSAYDVELYIGHTYISAQKEIFEVNNTTVTGLYLGRGLTFLDVIDNGQRIIYFRGNTHSHVDHGWTYFYRKSAITEFHPGNHTCIFRCKEGLLCYQYSKNVEAIPLKNINTNINDDIKLFSNGGFYCFISENKLYHLNDGVPDDTLYSLEDDSVQKNLPFHRKSCILFCDNLKKLIGGNWQ